MVATRHRTDSLLLIRIARFFGLQPFRVGRTRQDGKGVRWRDGLEVRGPRRVVELAVETYLEHRARLDEVLEYTAIGYLEGAFPREPDIRPAPGQPPPPAELLRAGLAGMMAAAARSRPTAPARPLLETTSGSGKPE